MEILIVLLLILLNGVFAMAEIAIISARKTKLQQQANEGNLNAKYALELSNSPNRFLSTVQIGITFIGIFAGAFGGETIAENLSSQWAKIPFIAPYSEGLALIAVVSIITYLSLVIGELVPKRLALTNPEKIAKFSAKPMSFLSKTAGPLVTMLSFSTDSILKLFRINKSTEPGISEEEVKLLVREGTRTGVFQKVEKDIFERTLRLSDKKVQSLMTSRKEIVWLDTDSPFRTLRKTISESAHSYFPVCRGNIDKVLGMVRTEDILIHFLVEEKIEIKSFLHKPLFVPENMDGLKVLEMFKKSGIHAALVIDEYGNIQGLISLNDVLEAIVGDIPTINELDAEEIVKRENGTFLIDGLVSIDDFKEYFHIKKVPDEKNGVFHTIGGFMMYRLGKIPASGDKFEFGDFSFEVMDMDGTRVDKILLSPLKK